MDEEKNTLVDIVNEADNILRGQELYYDKMLETLSLLEEIEVSTTLEKGKLIFHEYASLLSLMMEELYELKTALQTQAETLENLSINRLQTFCISQKRREE